jgi:hypothetical protein
MWRQDAWYLKEVSAVAQRLPSPAVSLAGSASLDMPAAIPARPFQNQRGTGETVFARQADIKPAAAVRARCAVV